MAIPERIESISTNLPSSQLTKVVDALNNETVEWVSESTTVFAESASAKFDFEGATYQLEELLEEVQSVALIAAKPEFVDALIGELESELSTVVNKRDYDSAKEVNEKIQNLSSLKTVEASV